MTRIWSILAVGYQVLPWLQPEVELNYSNGFLSNDNDQEVLATQCCPPMTTKASFIRSHLRRCNGTKPIGLIARKGCPLCLMQLDEDKLK